MRRLVAVAIVSVALLSCRSEPKAPAPQAADPQTPATRSGPDVAALTGYGKHEEAIRLGEELLQADPNDSKVLRDMAEACRARARVEPAQRDHWLSQAAAYADRFARTAEQDPARLYDAARLFRSLGDALAREGDPCPHYARAWQLLVRRGQLLEQGVDEARGGATDHLKRANKQEADTLQANMEHRKCTY